MEKGIIIFFMILFLASSVNAESFATIYQIVTDLGPQAGLSFSEEIVGIKDIIDKGLCIVNPGLCLKGVIIKEVTGLAFAELKKADPEVAKAVTTYNQIKGYVDLGAQVSKEDPLKVNENGQIEQGTIIFNKPTDKKQTTFQIGDLVNENFEKEWVEVTNVDFVKDEETKKSKLTVNQNGGFIKIRQEGPDYLGKTRVVEYEFNNLPKDAFIELDDQGNILVARLKPKESDNTFININGHRLQLVKGKETIVDGDTFVLPEGTTLSFPGNELGIRSVLITDDNTRIHSIKDDFFILSRGSYKIRDVTVTGWEIRTYLNGEELKKSSLNEISFGEIINPYDKTKKTLHAKVNGVFKINHGPVTYAIAGDRLGKIYKTDKDFIPGENSDTLLISSVDKSLPRNSIYSDPGKPDTPGFIAIIGTTKEGDNKLEDPFLLCIGPNKPDYPNKCKLFVDDPKNKDVIAESLSVKKSKRIIGYRRNFEWFDKHKDIFKEASEEFDVEAPMMEALITTKDIDVNSITDPEEYIQNVAQDLKNSMLEQGCDDFCILQKFKSDATQGDFNDYTSVLRLRAVGGRELLPYDEMSLVRKDGNIITSVTMTGTTSGGVSIGEIELRPTGATATAAGFPGVSRITKGSAKGKFNEKLEGVKELEFQKLIKLKDSETELKTLETTIETLREIGDVVIDEAFRKRKDEEMRAEIFVIKRNYKGYETDVLKITNPVEITVGDKKYFLSTEEYETLMKILNLPF